MDPFRDGTRARGLWLFGSTGRPFGISPVAFSNAGDLVALAGRDASVVIRRADTYGMVATLADPSPQEPGVVSHNAPMAIGFARDGSFVVASYSSGLAIWTCPDHTWPVDRHQLEVTLDGPATMPSGAMQTFVATHFGTDHVHAHRFFVDGVRVDAPGFARDFAWTAIAGSHEISVEVDDGIDTGRAAVHVSVAP